MAKCKFTAIFDKKIFFEIRKKICSQSENFLIYFELFIRGTRLRQGQFYFQGGGEKNADNQFNASKK